jgi:hypothetical protein
MKWKEMADLKGKIFYRWSGDAPEHRPSVERINENALRWKDQHQAKDFKHLKSLVISLSSSERLEKDFHIQKFHLIEDNDAQVIGIEWDLNKENNEALKRMLELALC